MRNKMGNRYYLTGSQLGMLMGDTDEGRRMKLLQEIMDEQCLNNKAKEALKRLRLRN